MALAGVDEMLTFWERITRRTFTISCFCKNCCRSSTYTLPYGARISYAPYLGYNSEETVAYEPESGRRRALKCKRCGIGNVA